MMNPYCPHCPSRAQCTPQCARAFAIEAVRADREARTRHAGQRITVMQYEHIAPAQCAYCGDPILSTRPERPWSALKNKKRVHCNAPACIGEHARRNMVRRHREESDGV